jgi:hypothetical protein
MAQEISPTEERVYDPLLGEGRDAFPGEVVDPEKEKTLNSLMRKARETFANQFDPVIATGQLTNEEINAIKKAANITAELKRKEYLDAIRSNPANILQGVLKEFNPKENPIVRNALISLDQNIAESTRRIGNLRSSDQIKGKKRDTISYAAIDAIRQIPGRGSTLTSFVSPDLDQQRQRPLSQPEQNVVFSLVKNLGFPPLQNLESFNDLLNAVISANNQPNSGMPYLASFADTLSLKGFQSKRPGLEGIQAVLTYDSVSRLQAVEITGTPKVFARIVDKGQYTPYR